MEMPRLALRIDIGAVEVELGAIHGEKWNDLNGDGVHEANEPGLPGWTIYLDANHNGVFDSKGAIEPDDYPLGTDLSHVVPGVTLSFNGFRFSAVLASTAGIASTGSQIIGGTWSAGNPLRVDFATPTNFVSIDALPTDSFTFALLEAFDSGGNLLDTYAAPVAGFDQFETMSISRANADISYVVASGYNGEFVYLDNLRFGTTTESHTVTDANGNYSFSDLPPGTYQVGEVPQLGWQQTAPLLFTSTLTQTVVVNSGLAVQGVDFGNHASPGSINGQLWYDANGDGVNDAGEPPLAGWTVFLDTNHDGIFEGGTPSVSSTDVPRSILDFQTTTSTILLSGLPSISDLNVTLDITHTFDRDLRVYLTSPAGMRLQLFGGVGLNGDNFSNTTLDDEAASSITNGVAPFAGSYKPQGLLSAFDGQNPNGVWTLEVSDTANLDVGVLNNWSLNFADIEPSTVTDVNGNYSFPNLTYGSYVVGEVLPDGFKQTYPGGPAATGLIVNGGFETGNFSGWTSESLGAGFVINNGSYVPATGDPPSAPFNGNFSALTDQISSGSYAIYQDVAIPAGSHPTLQWVDRIRNPSGLFIPGLEEFRVEVRDLTNTPIATLFSTQFGSSGIQDWTARSADLSAYAGETIRIAFVETNIIFSMNVGLDDVAITTPDGMGTTSVSVLPGEIVSGVQFGNQLVLPGDFNQDGTVNAVDYVVWRHAKGQTGASFVGADASGNGVVDDADYSIWRSHFGESVPHVGSGAAFGSAQAIAVSTLSNLVADGPKSVALSASLGDGTFAPVPDASGVYYSGASSSVTSLGQALAADLTVARPQFSTVGLDDLTGSPATHRDADRPTRQAKISSADRGDALLLYLSLRCQSVPTSERTQSLWILLTMQNANKDSAAWMTPSIVWETKDFGN